MSVVRVAVEVTEDGIVVGRREIGYFDGQPYHVELLTPDGVDWRMPERRAMKREPVKGES